MIVIVTTPQRRKDYASFHKSSVFRRIVNASNKVVVTKRYQIIQGLQGFHGSRKPRTYRSYGSYGSYGSYRRLIDGLTDELAAFKTAMTIYSFEFVHGWVIPLNDFTTCPILRPLAEKVVAKDEEDRRILSIATRNFGELSEDEVRDLYQAMVKEFPYDVCWELHCLVRDEKGWSVSLCAGHDEPKRCLLGRKVGEITIPGLHQSGYVTTVPVVSAESQVSLENDELSQYFGRPLLYLASDDCTCCTQESED